jgi:hypothetical protein
VKGLAGPLLESVFFVFAFCLEFPFACHDYQS